MQGWGGVSWVMKGWVGHVGVWWGWVMVGWVGHSGVGWGRSYRDEVGWVMKDIRVGNSK